MEEQATWRGHGFTFFVFTGIVFLCAIFFILGMLVGRSQGQKYAGGAEGKKAAPTTQKSGGDLDFSEDLQGGKLPPLVVDPPKEETPAEVTPPAEASKGDEPGSSNPPPPPSPPSASVLNIQVEAYGKSSAAADLVKALKKIGFEAFIVPPATGNPYYRVQVGPYADSAEAENAKQKLESAGYHPIVKK